MSSRNDVDLVKEMKFGEIFFEHNLDRNFKKLVESMMNPHKEQRPSLKEILANPIFSTFLHDSGIPRLPSIDVISKSLPLKDSLNYNQYPPLTPKKNTNVGTFQFNKTPRRHLLLSFSDHSKFLRIPESHSEPSVAKNIRGKSVPPTMKLISGTFRTSKIQ